MKNDASKTLLLLISILVGGAFFRLYGLKEQGFFFYDEGAQIHRAHVIAAQLALPFSQQHIVPNVYDYKPFWLALILLGQSLAGVQAVSAFFGILTIGLVYLFSREIGQPRPTALLSALFLALFSYHIFYSRLAIPETALSFGCLLGIFLFIKSLQTGKGRYVLCAGIVLGLTLLLNFRAIIIPPSLLLLQFLFWWRDRKTASAVKRIMMFVVPLLAVIPMYEAVLILLRILHIANLPSYFAAWAVNPGSETYFDIPSLWTIPHILIAMENPFLLVLFLVGCWAGRKNVVVLWLVLVLGLHLLACLFSMEKSFRIVSAVFVLIPVLAAIGFSDLHTRWGTHRGLRVVPLLIIILTIGHGILGALEPLSFRSAMPQAVQFVNQRFGTAPVLTTNVPLTRLYAQSELLEPLRDQRIADLQRLSAEGFGAVIIDPQKYIMSTASRNWNDLQLAELVTALQDQCEPLITYKNFSPRLLKFFLYEHVGPTLRQTRTRLQHLDEKSGYLSVYDLRQCAPIIQKSAR